LAALVAEGGAWVPAHPGIDHTTILVSFLVFSYAGLISVMPRAGGDYVWQSQLLTLGIGFVLAVSGLGGPRRITAKLEL
jgi:hypothetical protein